MSDHPATQIVERARTHGKPLTETPGFGGTLEGKVAIRVQPHNPGSGGYSGIKLSQALIEIEIHRDHPVINHKECKAWCRAGRHRGGDQGAALRVSTGMTRVREILVRKGIGGYHIQAATDKTSTVDLPGGGSETQNKQISAHHNDLTSAVAAFKHRAHKQRADLRRARIRCRGLDQANQQAAETLLSEATDEDWKERVAKADPDFAKRMGLDQQDESEEPVATFRKFLDLFEDKERYTLRWRSIADAGITGREQRGFRQRGRDA